MQDVWVGLGFVVLGIFALLWLIPAGIHAPSHLPFMALSPTLWPRIIVFSTIAIGVVLAAQSGYEVYRGHAREDIGGGEEKIHGFNTLLNINLFKTIIAMLLLIPYYIACEYIGLLLPSIVAFAMFSLLAYSGRYPVVFLCAIGLPVVLTWFFISVAEVVIPVGPLAGVF